MAIPEYGVRKFAINYEIDDCLIRLENQMYSFGSERSASSDRYSVEEYIRDIGQELNNLWATHHTAMAEKDREIADLKELLGEVSEAQTAAIISRQEFMVKCERMEALVKDAYEEGVQDAADEAMSIERGHGDLGLSWETSNARTALTETK